MSDSKALGIILTPRDLFVLRMLVTMRVLDGAEIKTIAGFATIRRTNRRLLKLFQAGLLRRWFLGTECGGRKTLYGLSPLGASHIGESSQGLIGWKQDSLITTSQFLAHQQAVNSFFIQARFQPLPPGVTCQRWMTFRLPLATSVKLVPDGYFEAVQGGSVCPMFLEVDMGTESTKVWAQKVELYLKLYVGGEYGRLFHEKRFRVLVLLHSERRLATVRRVVAKRTDKLFWFSTQDELQKQGLWNIGWLRPKSEGRQQLLTDTEKQ